MDQSAGKTQLHQGQGNRENNHVPESKGEEERVEVKKRPSIVISIQLDRLDKTRAQVQTTSRCHENSKQERQGKNNKNDNQDEAPYSRAPGLTHTYLMIVSDRRIYLHL